MYGYLWDEAGSLTDIQHSRLMVRPWQPEWQVVLINPYNAGDPADARSQGTGSTGVQLLRSQLPPSFLDQVSFFSLPGRGDATTASAVSSADCVLMCSDLLVFFLQFAHPKLKVASVASPAFRRLSTGTAGAISSCAARPPH